MDSAKSSKCWPIANTLKFSRRRATRTTNTTSHNNITQQNTHMSVSTTQAGRRQQNYTKQSGVLFMCVVLVWYLSTTLLVSCVHKKSIWIHVLDPYKHVQFQELVEIRRNMEHQEMRNMAKSHPHDTWNKKHEATQANHDIHDTILGTCQMHLDILTCTCVCCWCMFLPWEPKGRTLVFVDPQWQHRWWNEQEIYANTTQRMSHISNSITCCMLHFAKWCTP